MWKVLDMNSREYYAVSKLLELASDACFSSEDGVCEFCINAKHEHAHDCVYAKACNDVRDLLQDFREGSKIRK
jgi:hypothetical protein